MFMPAPNSLTDMLKAGSHAVIELTVNNHPGVMSHICGMFSRRAFNMDGILCLPLEGASQSRMWLLVNKNQQLDQIRKQVEKLHDVHGVKYYDSPPGIFAKVDEALQD